MRDEYFNNAYTLDSTAPRHEQSYQRVRERLWLTVPVAAEATLNVRLTMENYDWDRDSFKAPYRKGWVTSEAVIDQLNCFWRHPFTLPVTLVIGRQDIMLGDGWLVSEGTPLDGSRTLFFDAARATLQLSKRTTVNFIWVDQTARNRGRLPILNNQNIALEEQNDRSGLIYFSTRSLSEIQMDAYFIRRDTSRVLPNGDDARYSVPGLRVIATPTPHWQFKGETAGESGTKNNRILRAWGFLGQATWLSGDASSDKFRVSAEALSGDRPGTTRDEQFDVIWGRFPRWGEVPAMLYKLETRIGQFGNLLRAGPGWSSHLARRCDVALDYNALWAMENNCSTANGYFSAAGRFRGHAVRSVLKYRFSSHWDGTLQGEVFVPGCYYNKSKQDAVAFVRAESVWSF